jgi:hypothetical protein
MGNRTYTCTQNRHGEPHSRQMMASTKHELKREEAEERVKAWQILSPKDQLAELDKRGVAAVKQRARIEARMAAAKAKAATPKAKKEEVKKNKPRGKGGNLKRGRKDGHKHQ